MTPTGDARGDGLPVASAAPRALAAVLGGDFTGMIPAPQVAAMLDESGLDPTGLMLDLVALAATYSRPAISGFRVGAVLQGEPPDGSRVGALYLGANMEFAGQALSFSVHAEQSALTRAWAAGERRLTSLAATAPPCGYCRQFLSETTTGGALVIALPGRAAADLTTYLPGAFGPADLGVAAALLEPQRHGLRLAEASDDPLVLAALDAADRSYAPYTGTYAGVAVSTASGASYAGRYAENAAYSPSMSPLQAALALAVLAGHEPSSITSAVLVQVAGPADQTAATSAVLDAVAGIRPETHVAVPGSAS